VRRAKDALHVPVIGSLNGVSSGAWVSYAHEIEQAAANALELNVYFVPTDPYQPGSTIEQEYVDLLSEVLREVSIPVAVKLSPYLTKMWRMSLGSSMRPALRAWSCSTVSSNQISTLILWRSWLARP